MNGLKRTLIVMAIFSVGLLDTCRAAKGRDLNEKSDSCYSDHYGHLCRPDMEPSPIIDALLKSKDILKNEDPALFESLLQSETEFKQTLKDVLLTLVNTQKYRFAPEDGNSIGTLGRRLYFSSSSPSTTYMALPHEIFLGTVARSAVNLKKYNLVVFDQRQWVTANLKERQLLTLTEALGLKGIDAEEDRYRVAVLMLNAVQDENDRRAGYVSFNPAERSYEAFDLSPNPKTAKFFISEINGKTDEVDYLIYNSSSAIFHPRQCRKQQPEPSKAPMSFLERAQNGMIHVDQTMIDLCHNYLLSQKNVPLRFFYSNNNVVTNCLPEFAK